MITWVIAAITFGCVFGGALLGMGLRGVLPEHHLREESKDMVKLVTGLIATLSALVLGLLIASAKGSFDEINQGFRESAAKIILADRTLAQYGPEANDARAAMREAYAKRISMIFPEDGNRRTARGSIEGSSSIEAVERKIEALTPATERQRALQTRALQITYEIAQTRWKVYEEVGIKTPPVFLAVLVSWLSAMFTSFGLFAPRNRTMVVVLGIGALAVATAVFLIEEMSNPFGGVIAISSTPMRDALELLGK